MTILPPLPPPRPFLEALEEYIPGEQPREPGFVKLNTNEFPYPAAPEVVEAIRAEAADTVRVYPDPVCTRLRTALGERYGVDPEMILAGNGSDEILRYLAHAYLGAGRRLAVVQPTYTLYQVLASMFEAQVAIHPLVDQVAFPESIFTDPWDACFLPVPNPPLGTVFPLEGLRRLAAHGGLLVLDGAYIDFAPDYDPRVLLNEFPNVVLTGTFSKSFGLAGVRVGYLIGQPDLVRGLHKLRDSYNVNRLSQAAALGALHGSAYYRGRCNEIIASRESLARELTRRGFTVPPSQGNFLFARRAGARELYQALKARKILVRYFSHSGLQDGLRITIGTPAENQALLATLDAIDAR